MIKSILLVFCVLSICTNSAGQDLDSLQSELEQLRGIKRVPILHQLSRGTWLNYPEKALEYSQEALSISEEFGDSVNISKSLRHVGAVHYYQGDHASSLDYNIRALGIALAISDSSLMSNGYNNVGLLNYNLGDYQTALEYFIRAREIKDNIGEVYGLATNVNNIGLVFERVKEYDLARDYFEEAYLISIETNDRTLEVYSQNNLGITYYKQGDFKMARRYYEKALALARHVNNINYGSVSLRRIGQVVHSQGQLDSAFNYYQISLEYSRSISDKRGMSEVFHFLSRLMLDSKKPVLALQYLNDSHEIATDLKLRQQLLDNLKLFAAIYQNMQKNEQSIEYLTKYISLRDSLFQEVGVRNLSLIPIKLKQEEERTLLAKQQVEIQNQIERNRLYAIILIAFGSLLLFLVIVLRKNRIANRVLRLKNKELTETQDLLVKSEKLASLGTLAAGIGHEINNPLNFIKNGTWNLSKEIEKELGTINPLMTKYLDIIREGVDRAVKIVKSLDHFNKVGIESDERHDIHEVIDQCLTILNNEIKYKIELVKDFTNEPVIVYGNEGRLHQAFMSILSNAGQSIEKEGIIVISTSTNQRYVEISFRDTGIGIPKAHLLKINDPFFTTKNPDEGTGLGLFITHSIIDELGGGMQITSNENEGTNVIITLPLASV